MNFTTLSNGLDVPTIGLGTWRINNDQVVDVVKQAIELGYRHIDTAALYENEQGVGQGIKNSGVSREEIFVTTKIPDTCKTYEEAVRQIHKSLELLDMEYIDLMLIHSPRPFYEMFYEGENKYYEENLSVWKAMCEYYNKGKLKSIGVSNFSIEDIKYLRNQSPIVPMVNQVLVNIANYPKQLIDDCHEMGVAIMSYSPNATGRLSGDKIRLIAEKYDYSLPQLGIRFNYQLGTIVLPRSTNKAHMIENLNIEQEISDEDMSFLKSIGVYEGWRGADSEWDAKSNHV